MASKNTSPIYLPDGSFDWSGGVDSSLVPTLRSDLNPTGLGRNQLAWMNNCTVRGGGITQRTGWQPILKVLAGGRWQGGFMYEPDGANPYLVCQVAGILYSVLLEAPFTVTDLTGGNVTLRNPASAEIAWFEQGENYLIVQAGDYYTGPATITVNDYGQPLIETSTTLPLFWNGTTLRRSRGLTTAAPPLAPNFNEIPAATCMDYFANRLWYAQARRYSAGDMVGGAAGTIANRRRDAILNVTENPLCAGGDGFTVPTNAGNIRALAHTSTASANANLDIGQFYIFTRKSIYTVHIPTSRDDWIRATTNNGPYQSVVQINNGSVNDRSIVAVNGDLFYQSFDPAIRSLTNAVRNFQQWGNTPISQNELRALQGNNRALMKFSSGIEFDNRLLNLVLPVAAADGVNVVHSAILPLDFDVVTNFAERKDPVWEGAQDGLQFLQLFAGDFGGRPRAFSAAISDVDGSIMVWEFDRFSRTENGDNRVTYAIESPAFTWATSGLEWKLKQLNGGELWLDKISGTVDVHVEYRVDSDPCWRFWLHTSVCAARNCGEQDPVKICYPEVPACEGYRWAIGFPEPSATCDSMGIRPTTIGYQFQVKITIKGWSRIRGLILHALAHTEPQFHNIAQPPSGMPVGMAQLQRMPNPFPTSTP